MEIRAAAIICAVKAHGESGAVVKAFTQETGLLAAYVQGAKGKEKRPILMAGNRITGAWRARVEAQLPSLQAELTHSMGHLLSEPLATSAVIWVTMLTTTALPEAHPYPDLYDMLEALLSAIEYAPSARGWACSLVRYEALLLACLGFGMDLSHCTLTHVRENLTYVSPRTGKAVSQAAGGLYKAKLLALPKFLLEGGEGDWPQVFAGFALTGHFLEKHIVQGKTALLMQRSTMVERLKKAANH
jgi:DNA repair protein RecO (recombination protein O)